MDIYGNKKPVQIETGEWWFNGRIIQKQTDNRVPRWISFEDNASMGVEIHENKKEAIKFALDNPCPNPRNMAYQYGTIPRMSTIRKLRIGARFKKHEGKAVWIIKSKGTNEAICENQNKPLSKQKRRTGRKFDLNELVIPIKNVKNIIN